MLVHFSFDNTCFLSKFMRDQYNPSIHLQLKEYWKQYGVLVFPKNLDFPTYLNTIDQNHKQLWLTVLTSPNQFKVKKLAVNWNSLEQLASLNPMYDGIENYSNFFKVLFSDEEQVYLLTESGVISRVRGLFEIITPGQILTSNYFNDVKFNFEKPTIVGDDLDGIWTSKFSQLCEYCTDITIIDRYLFKSVVEDNLNNSISSLEFFLKKISIYNRKFRIIIISSIEEVDNDVNLMGRVKGLGAQTAEEAVNTFINKMLTAPLKMNISSFKGINVENNFFRIHGHDRYFRFDNSYFRISRGLNFMRDMVQKEDNNFDYFIGENVVKNLILSVKSYKNSDKIFI